MIKRCTWVSIDRSKSFTGENPALSSFTGSTEDDKKIKHSEGATTMDFQYSPLLRPVEKEKETT